MLRASVFGLGGLLLGGPTVAVVVVGLLPLLCGLLGVIRYEPTGGAGWAGGHFVPIVGPVGLSGVELGASQRV